MLKIFETFDILKFVDEINKMSKINIDPYNEEDWDEIENGDIVFYITINNKINFEKYDGSQNLNKFKKLNRESILNSIIKMRNRQITKNKIENETIFRKINHYINNHKIYVETLIKNAKIVETTTNITIDDIINKRINNFIIYYISSNKNGTIIDKYKATLNINENNIFLDNWWDEVEKYKGEIGISFKQITFNNVKIKEEPLNTNLYMTQLKYLIEKNEIILESKNILIDIKKILNDKLNDNLKYFKNELIDIKSNMDKDIKKLKNILKMIEYRFPEIKKPS